MIAVERRRFKIRDFVKAIRLNGYEQGFEHMLISDESNPLILRYACAIGQAALNLGVSTSSLGDSVPNNIIQFIIGKNDADKFSLEQIADQIEEVFPQELDDEIEASRHDYGFTNYQGVKI